MLSLDNEARHSRAQMSFHRPVLSVGHGQLPLLRVTCPPSGWCALEHA